VSKEIQKIGVFVLVAVVLVVIAWPGPREQQLAAPAPQISVQRFGQYLRDWSEPEGYFDSDNFISNETSYEHVIGELRSRVKPGGVYVGVGPDQNLTYIANTHPSLAIIVDIRRQNMLEHLLFKALMEQASSRAEYLSLLFAKAKPIVRQGAGFEEILKAVRAAPSSEEAFQQHLQSVKTILSEKYNLALSHDDWAKIEYTYRAFWKEHLDLRFSSIGRFNASQYPTFEMMLTETDLNGRFDNYLSSDELFNWIKKFESENRLIPIVGDFGGTHAFRTISQFLKQNQLQVSVFYTSNVEFYLFGTPAWAAFLKNVHLLPISSDSVFIRSYFATAGPPHPLHVAGHRSTSLVQAIQPFLKDYDAGKITTYWNVVNRSQ
jgi:hypothetical protein